jgi:hypothetical protein
VVFYLRHPLGRDIITRAGGHHRKADEKYVSLGVAEGAQPIVVFLSSRVPQAKRHWNAIYDHRRRVVVKSAMQCNKQLKFVVFIMFNIFRNTLLSNITLFNYIGQEN